jgi:hypothetical protein
MIGDIVPCDFSVDYESEYWSATASSAGRAARARRWWFIIATGAMKRSYW